MKIRRLFLLFVFAFTACSPQTPAASLPMATKTETETPVPSPTRTSTPTLAPRPTLTVTPTRIPATPTNISYEVVGEIPQHEIDAYLRGVAIMQGYLCTMFQMCDFKETRLLIGTNGCGAVDTAGGKLIYLHVQECGLPDPTELQLIGAAAGESAIAYTIQQQGCMTNTGRLKIPPYWFEGANAYYREHSLIWAGETGNTQGLTPEEWIYRRYVRESPNWDVDELFYMDNSSLDNDLDNWWHRIVVGYVMFEYLDSHPELITVTPEPGAPALLVTRLCKALIQTGSLDEAFKMIGVDRRDLYARLAEYMAAECAKPDIVCDGEAEPSTLSGQIIWSNSYPHDEFGTYSMSFCPSKGGDCLDNIPIQSDGKFTHLLPTGSFQISLNRLADGVPIGWYSKDGMATDQACADSVYVGENKNVDIDFYVAPIQCAK